MNRGVLARGRTRLGEGGRKIQNSSYKRNKPWGVMDGMATIANSIVLQKRTILEQLHIYRKFTEPAQSSQEPTWFPIRNVLH